LFCFDEEKLFCFEFKKNLHFFSSQILFLFSIFSSKFFSSVQIRDSFFVLYFHEFFRFCFSFLISNEQVQQFNIAKKIIGTKNWRFEISRQNATEGRFSKNLNNIARLENIN